jgi:glutamyl-tRNA synthetase
MPPEEQTQKPQKSSVRTRFAPSPTGALHSGTVRTALFAWLVARHAGGTFILRIEDTDQAREVDGAVQNIMDSLRFLGIEWDEGPDKGGTHGPYIQSERLDTYKKWADTLVANGLAYADPYSQEELQGLRDTAKAAKKPFLFRDYRPENPPEWDGSQPLRLKSDPRVYTWHDEVMGDLSAGPESIDDFILIKSDGFPTYNFAHIIDDHLMDITHVIRSQEFISSMPRYINLYEALDITQPLFAIVPNVLAPDGKRKLSKREGARQILEYKKEGYLPEALVNFLASLGWNDGTEQEVFSVAEIIEKFSLSRVQRAGARFDEQRLLWMDGAHIRELNIDDLYARSLEYWPPEANSYDENYKKQVLGLIQERLKYLAEIPQLTAFFFSDLPVNAELITGNKQLKKFEANELKTWLLEARVSVSESDFSVQDLTERLNRLLESTGQKPGVLFNLIRVATTQSPSSPGLADTLAVLGKERSLSRLDTQLAAL